MEHRQCGGFRFGTVGAAGRSRAAAYPPVVDLVVHHDASEPSSGHDTLSAPALRSHRRGWRPGPSSGFSPGTDQGRFVHVSAGDTCVRIRARNGPSSMSGLARFDGVTTSSHLRGCGPWEDSE